MTTSKRSVKRVRFTHPVYFDERKTFANEFIDGSAFPKTKCVMLSDGSVEVKFGAEVFSVPAHIVLQYKLK